MINKYSMDFEKLRLLAEENEVELSDHDGFSRTPPFYYDSLRHGLISYFNTFNTKNHVYDYNAMGLSDGNVSNLKREFLDEENTVLSLISFARFFELLIKDILRKVDIRLTYSTTNGTSANKVKELISKIKEGTFKAKEFEGKPLSAPFRDCLNRFYEMVEQSKNNDNNPIVERFTLIFKKYAFFDSKEYEASMRLLSWYRDRILHNGSKLPSLWYLDYFISQRLIPIIKDIAEAENDDLGESLFYLKTITGVNILDKLAGIKYGFDQLEDKQEKQRIFGILLYIGHLKELGRANLNMNIFVRHNHATHEYNYKDPKGRGKRFANAERNYSDFKDIKKCPCCNEESLVIYKIETKDVIFNPEQMLVIEWLKCYTCDYHLRYNVYDPSVFRLSEDQFFGK